MNKAPERGIRAKHVGVQPLYQSEIASLYTTQRVTRRTVGVASRSDAGRDFRSMYERVQTVSFRA